MKMEQMCKKATKVLINPLGPGSPARGALRKREPRGSGERGRDSEANEGIRRPLAHLFFCLQTSFVWKRKRCTPGPVINGGVALPSTLQHSQLPHFHVRSCSVSVGHQHHSECHA